MNGKKAKYLLLLIFGISTYLYGETQDANIIEADWIRQARVAKMAQSYKMTERLDTGSKDYITIITYQKVNDDGSVWMREERQSSHGALSTTIINNEGTFEIIGNTVIKNMTPNRPRQRQAQPTTRTQDRMVLVDPDNYLIDGKITINRQEHPQRFKDLEELYHRIITTKEMVPRQVKTYLGRRCYVAREKSEDNSRTEYLIDQETHFILRKRNYDPSGRLTEETACLSFQINPEFDDKLFQIPEHMSIEAAKDVDGMNDLYTTAFSQKDKPVLPSRNYFNEFMTWCVDITLSYGSYFFGILGVALLSFCYIMKLKQRRT